MDQNINNLSKADIISIIKACEKHEVKTIKVGGLELEFKQSTESKPTHFADGNFKEQPPEKPAVSEQTAFNLPNNLDSENLEELMILDPAEYEEKQMEMTSHG